MSSEEDFGELQELLVASFPKASKNECLRFLRARDGELEGATNQLKSFMEWREEHELDKEPASEEKDDEALWKRACLKATKHDCEESIELPRCVRTYGQPEMTASDGTLVLQVIPAQIDIDIAPAETYALAMAFWVFYKTDPDTLDKVTVCLDVRAGTGWPNLSAYSLLPFIKTVSSLLNNHFPERLKRVLLYPMPSLSLYVWEAAKLFLDEETSNKITLLSGAANEDSPAPKEEMLEYMSEEVFDTMENGRKEAFLESDTTSSSSWFG